MKKLVGLIAWAIVAGVTELTAGEAPTFVAAKPCWAEGRNAEANVFLVFRTAFPAASGDRPVLRVTGHSAYRIALNGKFVAHGPARAVVGHFRVDEWALPAVAGTNELTIQVAGYHVPSFQYVPQDSFLQAEIVLGGKVLAATPGDFSAREDCRSRREPVHSRQRGIPLEVWKLGTPAKSQKLVETPPVKYLPREVPYPEFRLNESFAPIPGRKGLYGAPFNDTGFLGLRVKCRKPGRVAMRYDEALVGGKVNLFRNGNPSNDWHACFHYVAWDIPAPGDYEIEAFEPATMKYVQVDVESGEMDCSAPYLREYKNPLAGKRGYESDDPELKAIFEAARESFAQNAVDIFTDCPCRERSGWLCDTWFTAHTAAWLTGDTSIERTFLEIFAMTDVFANTPQGAISAGYPTGAFIPTYMMWYALQVDECFRRLGKDEAEAFRRKVARRLSLNVDFLRKYRNADGLLENLPGWIFIEWSDANKFVGGVNYPANMMWSAALEATSRICLDPSYAEEAARVRKAVVAQSFDGTWFHDHAVRGKDGVLARQPDITEVCQYYAFFAGVASQRHFADLWRRVVNDFGPGRTPKGLHRADMFPGILLRLELLVRDGHYDQVKRELKAYVGPMAKETGTLWEFSDGHDSRCHAFPGYAAVLLLKCAEGEKKAAFQGRASKYDVAAYVWPAYQPEPRWAELGIFGAGKGEWQNVWEAVPKWEGHDQPRKPLWGYENEADPKAVEKKIEAAISHGVNVFIYDWYWYGGRPFLEDALDKGFLGASNNGKMKFFLMWANHHVNQGWNNKVADKMQDGWIWHGWQPTAEYRKIVARWIAKYFSRPNYYRIGGKPVLMIYEIKTFVEAMGGLEEAKGAFDFLRAESVKAGLGGVHLMGCDYGVTAAHVRKLGIDSATIYNLIHWASSNGNPDYDVWAHAAERRFDVGRRELGVKAYFAHTSVGWDTNPRYPKESVQPTVCNSTPEKFAASLRRVKTWCDSNTPAGYPRLITINSWNEWTEGSYLEPDEKWGFGYLKAIKSVFGSEH